MPFLVAYLCHRVSERVGMAKLISASHAESAREGLVGVVGSSGQMALVSVERGPGFDSQHPHGDSQVSVTLVSGDPMPSPDSCGHQAHT